MRIGTLLIALLAVAALGCSDGPTDNDDTPIGDIIVRNNFFDPGNFVATAGDEVVWAWSASAATHNITFEDDAPGSPSQSSGTFARTFTATGEYPYLCTIHGAAMSGTVSVVAAGDGGPWDY